MRDLILDFKRGGASVPEVVHGIVRIWGTEVRPNGPSVVVTTETTLKLSDGKATLANAQTSGTGPLYEWAYIIQVEPFCGRNYRFYVAIPDGTGPINLVDLPKLNPITGEGFYLDIEEWEALYGDLPSRVDALETSQGTQNTQIAALQTGKANTVHTHVIGDVTGLQPALNAKGNATMRVDTTVGTRVFITDGVTERMISGDTGWRNISSELINGWTGAVWLKRDLTSVKVEVLDLFAANATDRTWLNLPLGFRPSYSPLRRSLYLVGTPVAFKRVDVSNTLTLEQYVASDRARGGFEFDPNAAWPTTLPGTPA